MKWSKRVGIKQTNSLVGLVSVVDSYTNLTSPAHLSGIAPPSHQLESVHFPVCSVTSAQKSSHLEEEVIK